MSKVMTKAEFIALTPYQKGYAVYMAGCRSDQPNIPETYNPKLSEKRAYDRGQMDGVFDAQECP